MRYDLSFVVPFRNEIHHLAQTVKSLSLQQLAEYRVEVLLVDGQSDDGSSELAAELAKQWSRPELQIRVVSNEARTTPHGFNMGIQAARSPVIGFGGAHTEYPADYFATAIRILADTGADVVGGGFTEYRPSSHSTLARAMSFLYQSRMGSGVASYHTKQTAGFVDTVYGGFYLRQVFDRIGLFNTRLTRNQDNELNSRVLAAGMKIYFDPRLSTAYLMKTDLKTFIKRGYMFGRFHPETWLANPGALRVRHAAPFLALLYGVAAVLLAGATNYLSLLPIVLYVLLLIGAAARIAVHAGPRVAALTLPLFAAYHFAYALGTLVGVVVVALGAARYRASTALR